MIGNETDARLIWEFAREVDDYVWPVDEGNPEGIPAGFDYFGEGAFRKAFLKGNVVYKVEHAAERGYANEMEYINYCRFSTVGREWVCMPVTNAFFFGEECVIAMEYVGRQRPAWSNDYAYTDAVRNWCRLTGIGDIHLGNVRVLDNVLYCIDLGYNTLDAYPAR